MIFDLVSVGYSDLSLQLSNGDRIDVIKSMLCYSNEIFKKLVNDSQCENPLKLAEGISKESINLLIQYYGCGKIDINEDNVGNMMILCLYYNEKDLLLNLIKYCLNHVSLKIVKCILNNLDIFKSEIMFELYKESENFIKENCIYLFGREELLEINLDGIKHILSLDNLKLNNENQILNGLLEYYKEKKEEIENDKKCKSQFEELFKYVKWGKFTIESIPYEQLESFNGIDKIILKSSKYEVNHEYYPIPEISNPKLLKYLNKYCFNPNPLLNDDFRSNELEIEDLDEEDVIKIFNFNNLRLIKIMIITINKYKKKFEIEDIITHKFLYDMLLIKNKNKEISEIENQLTLMSLPLIINNESISKIYNTYGYKILFELLNISQLLFDIISLISSFIKKLKILEKENVRNEMKVIIKDEKMQRIILNPLTYFKYPSNYISVDLNKETLIKCENDGNNCVFSISPDLPNGLKFNEDTGEIIIESNYTLSRFECEVKCKQYYIEKSFKLLVENYKFIEKYKSDGISISDNGKKLSCNDESDCHCYLNIKMESGIYHIKYKTSFTRDNIPGFGVSTINNYDGQNIYKDNNSLSIWMDGTSKLYGRNQVTNPKFAYKRDDIYELIYDMDKRIISIKQNYGKEYIIFKNIPSPLYPFIFTKYINRYYEIDLNIIEICN